MPYMLKTVMTENCIIESRQNQTHTYTERNKTIHRETYKRLADRYGRQTTLSF